MRRLLLAALLLPSPAWAGGYFYSDSGVVALGRGGAWVAGADTRFAQYYNPAGLIRIDAPTFDVGYSAVQQDVKFDRLVADDPNTPEVEAGYHPTADNQAPPFSVPEIGFATPIGRKVAVAFGFTSPFAPSSLYDEAGAQRYTVIDTTIYQFQIGPAVAYQPVPWLTFGLGLQWQYLEIGQQLKLTTALVDGPENPAGDIDVRIHGRDMFTPNANLGVLFEPVPELSVGISVQPPSRFDAEGSAELDFAGNSLEALLDATAYRDDEVFLGIDLPLVLRGGVAVRPVPTVEMEAAVVWQRWSSLEDITIREVDVALESQLDLPDVPSEFVLPAGLSSTASYRLGGEWRATDELALRAGGFWESGSLPPQDVSVALYDPSKWQAGGGASVFLVDERLRFDASGAFLQFRRLDVRDSTVTQVNALDGPELVVGNGDYRSTGWILGAAASWAFTPHRGAE